MARRANVAVRRFRTRIARIAERVWGEIGRKGIGDVGRIVRERM